MTITAERIASAIAARMGDAQQFLADLIATPSLSGQESAAMELVERAFAKVSDVRRVPMTNALRDDKDYSDPIPGIEYDGRWNVRACQTGSGGGRTLLLNTHIDTVPPAQGQPDPFTPLVRDGVMFGRGACDAKGQAATIYLAMAALKDLGIALRGDLVAHLVVEEENGGNGTLAMARALEQADACLVLEPTDMKILPAIRGAVWFRITLAGKAGHSGQAGITRSALKMAVRVMEILEGYHARLLAGSRGGVSAMFDKFPNPMPLTIGRLHAGNWPASAPAEATLEGVLGLLPNKTAQQVMAEMTAAIRDEGGPDIAQNFAIHFTYRHDSSVCPADHPLVKALLSSLGQYGDSPQKQGTVPVDAPSVVLHGDCPLPLGTVPTLIDAMTASCDAWLYNNHLGIPTAVFGGGSLSVAHSAREQMPLGDLQRAAEAVANLAVQWCG